MKLTDRQQRTLERIRRRPGFRPALWDRFGRRTVKTLENRKLVRYSEAFGGYVDVKMEAEQARQAELWTGQGWHPAPAATATQEEWAR